MESITQQLAAHVSNIRYEELPEDVVHAAKQHILDGLGNQIAASAISEQSRIMANLLNRWGGKPESTVVGYGYRLPAPNAALINAMMGHGVELDDAHGAALTKAGSSLVPTIMAVGEAIGVDGKTLIVAIVAGYEAAIRIGLAINPSHRKRGYHTSGTAGTFGTASAAARAMGLNAEQTAWALGIASIQAAGIQAFLKSPSMVKPFSPGKAAYNGVLSAFMAREGFIGPVTALENEEGFLRAFADEVKYDELVRGYGHEWKILEVGYKPHAACRYAHGPIDAAQYIKRHYGVKPEHIQSIIVTTCELANRQSGHSECSNLNQAMGSTPFGVALALARGGNNLKDYWDGFNERFNHELAAKVEMKVDLDDPGMGVMGRAARVEVVMKSGEHFIHRVEAPKGEPEQPLSTQELDEKFLSLARMVLPEENVQNIYGLVKEFEKVRDMHQITANFVAPQGNPKLR